MLYIILTVLIVAAFASLLEDQLCPSVVKTPEDFKISDFEGVWNEIARYPNDYEISNKCVSYNFTLEDHGYRADSINTQQNTEESVSAEGRLRPNENGVLNFTLGTQGSKNFLNLPKLYYLVLNRKSLFVSYACHYNTVAETRQEYVWIFSRAAEQSSKLRFDILSIIEANNLLDMDKFIWIDHNACDRK